MKKKTHEEYLKELKIKNPTVEVIEKYKTANTPILHKCLIHNICWNITPSRALYGNGCPQCASEKITQAKTRTHEEYISLLENNNIDIIPLEAYINGKVPILHKCLKHNVSWKAAPNNILGGHGCTKCLSDKIRNKNGKTHDQYIAELKVKHPNIIAIERYRTANIPILHKCLIDSYEWKATPGNILFSTGCPKCGGTLKKTHEQYVAELESLNPNIKVVGEYKRAKEKVLYECKIDGTQWEAYPCSVLAGTGCPTCRKSKGEKQIENWMQKNNINYVTQKTFKDCKDKHPLPFDFYLPDYNVCIEYDGKQHFKPIKFFGGEEAFYKRVEHDKIKDDYCKTHGIKLLRISYIENVQHKLSDFLFNTVT